MVQILDSAEGLCMQQICCYADLTLWLSRQTGAAIHAVIVANSEWCQHLSRSKSDSC